MKITDKHRIKYKSVEAPGEPVEMAIYRDDKGNFVSATGDIVAYEAGRELSGWVRKLLDGTSEYLVGEIIPPPLEPYVGMVVENPDDTESYFVCYKVDSFVDGVSDWVSSLGHPYREPLVLRFIERDGWRVRKVTP